VWILSSVREEGIHTETAEGTQRSEEDSRTGKRGRRTVGSCDTQRRSK
jgi:hypothetical protein